MRGAPWNGQAKVQRSGLGGGDRETGRLQDDGPVARVTAQHRSQCAQAPVLLTHDALEEQRTAQRSPGVEHRLHPGQPGDQRPLHIQHPATVDAPAPDVHLERRRYPTRLVARRHDIDMAVQHEGGSSPGGAFHVRISSSRSVTARAPSPHPVNPPHHPQRIFPGDFGGVVGVAAHFGLVDLPHVEAHPQAVHRSGHVLLGGALPALPAGDRHQARQDVEQPRLVDGGERGGLGPAERGTRILSNHLGDSVPRPPTAAATPAA